VIFLLCVAFDLSGRCVREYPALVRDVIRICVGDCDVLNTGMMTAIRSAYESYDMPCARVSLSVYPSAYAHTCLYYNTLRPPATPAGCNLLSLSVPAVRGLVGKRDDVPGESVS